MRGSTVMMLTFLSQDPLDQVQDQRERWRRQEEEQFQARNRSDPNLARRPVKAPPSDDVMRLFVRQRRHGDVSLAASELELPSLRAGEAHLVLLTTISEQQLQLL